MRSYVAEHNTIAKKTESGPVFYLWNHKKDVLLIQEVATVAGMLIRECIYHMEIFWAKKAGPDSGS